MEDTDILENFLYDMSTSLKEIDTELEEREVADVKDNRGRTLKDLEQKISTMRSYIG